MTFRVKRFGALRRVRRIGSRWVALLVLCCGGSSAIAATPIVYDLRIEHGGTAEVRLCVASARKRIDFSVDALRSVRVVDGVRRSSGRDLRVENSHWTADAWRADECLLYTADLAAIASTRSDAGTRYGDALVSDPTYWLMQADVPAGSGAAITVHEPDDALLSVPWRLQGREGRTARYVIPDTPRSWSGSVVLGRIDEHDIAIGDATLRVALLESGKSSDAKTAEMVQRWMRAPAQAIAEVAGGFPVPQVRVMVVPVSQLSLPFRFAAWLYPSAVMGGESARGQGNALELVIDPARPEAEFLRDWTTFHELSHLMHPYLGDRGSWLSEGLATYYQTVLRARAGVMSERQAWQRIGEGFAEIDGATPSGRLEDVAAAMGKTHQYTYVYRSGAYFWLAADVELRRSSGGKLSLDRALAAFHACCLPSYREWRPEDFVEQLDRSLGVDVFVRRFRAAREATRFPDWQTLFGTLGIERQGDDFALAAGRDAAIRDAIMLPRVPASR